MTETEFKKYEEQIPEDAKELIEITNTKKATTEGVEKTSKNKFTKEELDKELEEELEEKKEDDV